MKPVIEVKHLLCLQPIANFLFLSACYIQSSISLFNIKLCITEQWQKTVFKADNSLPFETFLSPPFFIQIPTTFPEDTKQYSSLITVYKVCKKL